MFPTISGNSTGDTCALFTVTNVSEMVTLQIKHLSKNALGFICILFPLCCIGSLLGNNIIIHVCFQEAASVLTSAIVL